MSKDCSYRLKWFPIDKANSNLSNVVGFWLKMYLLRLTSDSYGVIPEVIKGGLIDEIRKM